MNYPEYIKNKRVCFVGASPILKGRKTGQEIDNFDVVVRTNGSIELLKNADFVRDYGGKIDVLYTNNQYYRETTFPISQYIKQGVKYLRMKTCKPKDLELYNKYFNTRIIKSTMEQVNQVNPSATMGAYILTDILKHNPKQLYVTGIDFFASKKAIFEHDNYQEYFEGYLPDVIRIQGNVINKGKTADGHSFQGNANYIYNLWKNNDNMVFPNYIENILLGIIEGRIKQK